GGANAQWKNKAAPVFESVNPARKRRARAPSLPRKSPYLASASSGLHSLDPFMSGKHRTEERPPAKKHHRLRKLGYVLLGLIVLLCIVRLMLPWIVQRYVNRTLDRNQMYSGTIGQVEIHLLRGAYSIRDIKLNKTTGDVPVPFFSAKRVDFAIQWNALMHHRIVARVV